jgi:6-pyruvoyl-tetrahydropterin synthase related domain
MAQSGSKILSGESQRQRELTLFSSKATEGIAPPYAAHSAPERTGSRLETLIAATVIVLVAVALTYPLLVKGLPDGDDRQPHLEYQHFFNEQVDHGDSYPRWIPGLNKGRGSGIFLVQYPLPYYVAWGFEHLIPNKWGVYTETRTQGLAIVLATILGALFTYAWCASFVDRLSAVFASIVFLTLPYFVTIDLYMRVAIGEFWALAMMALSLYFVERRATRPRRSLAGVAVAFALVLVTHLFTAILFVPVLLAYAAWRSKPETRLSATLQTATSLALGTGIAGVYTLPVLAHHRYLHPDRMIVAYGAGLWPLSHLFPYDASLFPINDPRWKSLGHIAQVLAAVVIILVGFVCYRSRAGSGPIRPLIAALSVTTLALTLLAAHLGGLGRVPGALPLKPWALDQRAQIFVRSFLTLEAALLCYWSLYKRTNAGLANFLAALALASYLMMTRWSLIIWSAVHPLWNVQFPWRFNVFLTLSTTGLAALALAELRTKPLRARVAGSALALVVWGLVAFLPAWRGDMGRKFWDTQSVAFERSQDFGLPVYAQVKDAREALDVKPSPDGNVDAVVTAGTGRALVSSVSARRIDLHANCDSDCTVQIGQFYYPAWKAYTIPASIAVPLTAAAPGGLMDVTLPQGEHDVALEYQRDWSERIGPWLSVTSLALAVVIALADRRNSLWTAGTDARGAQG